MFKEIIIAISSYFKAHRFIVEHRLWRWIVIPGIIYTILFIAGIYFFWHSSADVINYILSKTGVKTYMQRDHAAWLKFLFLVGQLIIHLALMFFYFSWFKYIFLIIGSPVFAYLSEKTDGIIQQKDFPLDLKQLFKDIIRGTVIALRNTFWQTVYSISILILSLIPVFGWATPVLALFVECYYFGFSMLDYSSERNKLSVSESIHFIGNHKGLAIGNGMIFYLMHGLPVIGWIFAPSYAVIAATLSLHEMKHSNTLN